MPTITLMLAFAAPVVYNNLKHMTTLTKLLLRDFKPKKLLQLKAFATYVEKELEVPTFCDVHIDLPYSVTVKPLNIHKYHNCDKLIIKIDERCKDSLQYDVDGNQVKIDETVERNEEDVMCYVKAPVKANLYINSKKDINIGYFHGDKLYATSQEGDVNVDRFQAGFDGKLKLVLEKGKANIHLFRISEESSEINILDGALKLRLADACQDYVQFLIKSETCEISENVKSTINNSGDVIQLIPDINADSSCVINCQGHTFVESASWQDMIKLRMQKRE
nr:unnamed protein product [Callosobruchus chinensis]